MQDSKNDDETTFLSPELLSWGRGIRESEFYVHSICREKLM